jgi:uncharacterized protein YjbJ (UPF0337 family)
MRRFASLTGKRARGWGEAYPRHAGFPSATKPSATVSDRPSLKLKIPIPMKPSTTNIARGDGNIAVGKTKEIAGKVVNSPKLKAKGNVQQAAGQIQKAVGKAQKSQGD